MFWDERLKIWIKRSNIVERNIDGSLLIFIIYLVESWFLGRFFAAVRYVSVIRRLRRRSSSVHTELIKESISLFKTLVSALNSMKSDFKSYKLSLVLDYKKIFNKKNSMRSDFKSYKLYLVLDYKKVFIKRHL